MQNDLISRSAMLGQIRPENPGDYRSAVLLSDAKKIFRNFLEEAPAVDAVEVVRCRDCKRCYKHITKRHKQTMWLCMRHDLEVCVRPDDFCSYGERRGENGRDK